MGKPPGKQHVFYAIPCDVCSQLHLTVQKNTTNATSPAGKLWPQQTLGVPNWRFWRPAFTPLWVSPIGAGFWCPQQTLGVPNWRLSPTNSGCPQLAFSPTNSGCPQLAFTGCPQLAFSNWRPIGATRCPQLALPQLSLYCILHRPYCICPRDRHNKSVFRETMGASDHALEGSREKQKRRGPSKSASRCPASGWWRIAGARNRVDCHDVWSRSTTAAGRS